MPSTGELTEVMAETLGVALATVAKCGHHLAEAGMWPMEDSPPAEPENAVDLLLAVMGGEKPIQAAEAVRVLGDLPATSFQRRELVDGIEARSTIHYVKDLVPVPGREEDFAIITSSFRNALLALVTGSAEAMPGVPFEAETIQLSRGLTAPLAVILTPFRGAPGYQISECPFYSAPSGDPAYASVRMATWAQVPGEALTAISRLFGIASSARTMSPPVLANFMPAAGNA